MPKILITGSSGLVGNYAIRRFLEAQYEVFALKRKNSDLSWLADIPNKINWIEGDILDVSLLNEATQDMDFVLHTAAIVSFDKRDKKAMYKINVEGTANIVNVCLENNVSKFCQVSSIAAIGRDKPHVKIDESHKWQNSKYNTNYAKSKYLAEMEVWRAAAEGLKVVIVNPSVILGASDWHRSSTSLFKYVWDEKKYYSTSLANVIDVRDVVDIIFELLVSDIEKERFILTANSLSYQALFSKISEKFGKKAPYKQITPFLANLAWRAEGLKSLLTQKRPLVTKETAQNALLSFHYDNEKIKNTLNYEFRILDDSIAWVCEGLKEYYNL